MPSQDFAPDDKSDVRDPFYIAERTRTHRPASTWSPQLDTLPLRFYTRLRITSEQPAAKSCAKPRGSRRSRASHSQNSRSTLMN